MWWKVSASGSIANGERKTKTSLIIIGILLVSAVILLSSQNGDVTQKRQAVENFEVGDTARKMMSIVRMEEEKDELFQAEDEGAARMILKRKLDETGEDAEFLEKLVSEWKISRKEMVSPDTQSPIYSNVGRTLAFGGSGGSPYALGKGTQLIKRICVRSGRLIDAIEVQFADGTTSSQRGGNGGARHCWTAPSGCISSIFIKTGSLVDGIMFGDTNGVNSRYYGGYGGHGKAISNPNMCLYRIHVRTGSLVDQMQFMFKSRTACGARVRRDWQDLSSTEKTRYLTGFKTLRTDGKLEAFTKEHIEASNSGFDSLRFHGNSGFLPWHRYFIWELEEQIRNLGGDYACFTLPYWDWTRGAGELVSNNPLWDSTIIGQNGGGSSGCVQNGLVSESSGYTISSVNGGSCLRRSFRGGSSWYQTTAQSMSIVESVRTYVSFRQSLEGYHNSAHVSVGGHLTSTSTATDDPVFYMLHCYVDMLWALRSDCHNYNQVSSPNDNNIFPTSEMSISMSYPELVKEWWAYVNSNTISVSSLLRTTSSPWSFTYDGSNMRSRSGMSMNACSWNEIPAMSEEKWSVQADGMGKIAHMVNVDVHQKQVKQDMTDPEIVAYTCKRMQELEVQHGYQSHVCKYTEPLEKCGPGPDRLDISLGALLSKRGVRGNPCIIRARRALYSFAKQTGTLRSLCNGLMDPVCPGSGNGAPPVSSSPVDELVAIVRRGEKKDELYNAKTESEAREILSRKLVEAGEDIGFMEGLVSEWQLAHAKVVADSQSRLYSNWLTSPNLGGGGGHHHTLSKGTQKITAVCVRSGSLIDQIKVRFEDNSWSPARGGNGGTSHCFYAASRCIRSIFIKTGSLVDGILFYESSGATSRYYGGYGGGGTALSNSNNVCLYRIDVRTGSLVDRMRFFFKNV